MGQIVEELTRKGVGLRVLDLGIDTGTATGQLILHVLASVAQFERSIMLERQREGVRKAKAEGRYRGRAPTARRQADQMGELRRQGATTRAIAERLGVSQRKRVQDSEHRRSERGLYRVGGSGSGPIWPSIPLPHGHGFSRRPLRLLPALAFTLWNPCWVSAFPKVDNGSGS